MINCLLSLAPLSWRVHVQLFLQAKRISLVLKRMQCVGTNERGKAGLVLIFWIFFFQIRQRRMQFIKMTRTDIVLVNFFLLPICVHLGRGQHCGKQQHRIEME